MRLVVAGTAEPEQIVFGVVSSPAPKFRVVGVDSRTLFAHLTGLPGVLETEAADGFRIADAG